MQARLCYFIIFLSKVTPDKFLEMVILKRRREREEKKNKEKKGVITLFVSCDCGIVELWT